jgi:hypothetical protein
MVWLVSASMPSAERRFRVAGPFEHAAALARFDRGHAFNRSPESRGGGSVVAARSHSAFPALFRSPVSLKPHVGPRLYAAAVLHGRSPPISQ